MTPLKVALHFRCLFHSLSVATLSINAACGGTCDAITDKNGKLGQEESELSVNNNHNM